MDLLGNSTWDRVILGFFRGHILKKLDFFQKIAIWAHCAPATAVAAGPTRLQRRTVSPDCDFLETIKFL